MSGSLWGPLEWLVGEWEGGVGHDLAPADDRGTETNPYRELMLFERLGPVVNHEQVLYGLRYRTTAWGLGEKAPFHEELGYFLWDARAGEVLRCFMVPRGVTIIAGGNAGADACAFELSAKLGSPTYGICSNKFLDAEFRSVEYNLKMEQLSGGELRYEEDTVIQIKGKPELFHHTDSNTLVKKGKVK